MKDIETMLSRHTPKPTRELRPAFTQTVLSEIKQHPQAPAKRTLLTTLLYFLKTAPGIAAIVAIVGLGSIGAYAAVNQVRNNTGGATVELSPTDPTIVTVDLNNCRLPSFQMPPVSVPFGESMALNGPTKFKIIQPDKISPATVKATILSWCEQQSVMDFYRKTYPAWFANETSRDYHVRSGMITGITDDSITIKYAWRNDYQTVTYPLQPGTTVYKDGLAMTQNVLHAGDNATFIMNKPDNYNVPGWMPTAPDASNSTLLSIAQTEYDSSKYSLFEATNSRVFMPLDLYNKHKAIDEIMGFYRKTYPAWFEHGAALRHFQEGNIKTLTDTAITITLPLESPRNLRNIDITYPIHDSLAIYDNGRRLALKNLKTGDRAFFVIESAETVHHPHDLSPANSSLVSLATL